MLTKLLQVSAGSIYSNTKGIIEFDVSNRMTALKEIIDEASHKVIVFCPFRHSIETIMTELRKDKITCETIHGDVTMNKRTEIFKNFQESKDPQVLVIQPQAASHGVTLHAANVVVFWSPVMSVETYIQCCARMDRAGQKNKMTVVHLQGSPVEKRIYKMLENKIDTHTKLVDLYKEEFAE
jgi:superfamily II DNA/RNA helicase